MVLKSILSTLGHLQSGTLNKSIINNVKSTVSIIYLAEHLQRILAFPPL